MVRVHAESRRRVARARARHRMDLARRHAASSRRQMTIDICRCRATPMQRAQSNDTRASGAGAARRIWLVTRDGSRYVRAVPSSRCSDSQRRRAPTLSSVAFGSVTPASGGDETSASITSRDPSPSSSTPAWNTFRPFHGDDIGQRPHRHRRVSNTTARTCAGSMRTVRQ